MDRGLKGLCLASFLLVVFYPVSCSGRGVKLPEYTKWPSSLTQTLPFILHGNRVQLKVEIYGHKDDNESSGVVVWCDTNTKPWLLAYQHKINWSPDLESYIFENKNGKWVFVKDASQMSNNELIEFIKDRYNLENVNN